MDDCSTWNMREQLGDRILKVEGRACTSPPRSSRARQVRAMPRMWLAGCNKGGGLWSSAGRMRGLAHAQSHRSYRSHPWQLHPVEHEHEDDRRWLVRARAASSCFICVSLKTSARYRPHVGVSSGV